MANIFLCFEKMIFDTYIMHSLQRTENLDRERYDRGAENGGF